MNLTELKAKPIHELVKLAETMGLENLARSRKQDIIFSILKAHARNGENIYGDGVLEILQDGFGFLRSSDGSYLAGPDDIYISPSQIRRFNLRTGDTVSGLIRPPKDGERYFALLKVGEINFDSPDSSRNKVLFENLDAVPSDQAPEARARQRLDRGSHGPHHRSDLAHRQGPARSHRLAAEGRQDDAAAEHRHRHHPQSSGSHPHRAAHRRAAGGSHRDAAHGEGRGRLLDVRRARRPSRAGGRDGHREGQAPRRAQEGRGDPAGFDHAPRARLQHRGAVRRARC